MGYNLKRLMNQYGVSTASKAGYAGNADPGAAPEQPIFTMQAFPEGSPEAIERAKILSDYQQSMYEYQPKKDAYDTDQSAYDAYSGSYDQRMQGTPMYAAKQFQTQKQVQPENFDQLFDKYLNSNSTAEQAMAGAAAISPYMKIDMEGNDGIQLTNPQAARNAFIQGIGPTLGTGIGNTGNQAIMEQSGKYYGNVLKNPLYSPSLAVETVDADGEVIDTGTGGDGTDTSTVIVSNDDGDPFFENTFTSNTETAGGSTGTDYNLLSGGGEDNVGNFGLVGDVFGNIGDALGITDYGGQAFEGYTPEEIDVSFLSDNVNADGTIGDNTAITIDSLRNTNSGLDVNSSDDAIFGDVSFDGNWQEVVNPGTNAITRTWVGGNNDNDDTDDTSNDTESSGGFNLFDWNTWQEGGSVKGITPSGRLIKGYASDGSVEDETLETITEVPTLDDLVNEQIKVQNEGGNNIAELRQMLAASSIPSGQNAGSIRSELGSARQKFMDLVTAQADSAGTGPSESEKWFRLAAAFGKPTQSGHFMENLGLANEAMAGVASERRAAKTDAAGLKLRGAEINIDFLKDDLAAATAASASERDYKRNLAETLMEFEISQVETAEQREFDLAVIAGDREYEAGKAKTTAAKMADDLGLTGTARNEWIVKYYDDQTELAKLEFQAAANAVNELSTGELNLKVKTEDAIAAADNTIGIINEAMSINDMAYAGNIWDSATKAFKGAFNVDDPRYKATERMQNLLSSLSLAQLKTTFGGQGITDSERKALDALQGLGSKTPAARLAILERALAVTKRVGLRSAKRLNSITSGTYGRKNTGDE